MQTYGFSELGTCPLEPSAIYLGGSGNGTIGEVLTKLVRSQDGKVGVGNVGGFRTSGRGPLPRLVVLTSNKKNSDWPDEFDSERGVLTYFGDNKVGTEYRTTPRGGNQVLLETYSALLNASIHRVDLPIFFHFEKHGESKDWRFNGQFAPGSHLRPTSDWLSIVETESGIINLRATFQSLGTEMISREWLDDVLHERDRLEHATTEYRAWATNQNTQS